MRRWCHALALPSTARLLVALERPHPAPREHGSRSCSWIAPIISKGRVIFHRHPNEAGESVGGAQLRVVIKHTFRSGGAARPAPQQLVGLLQCACCSHFTHCKVWVKRWAQCSGQRFHQAVIVVVINWPVSPAHD